MLKINYLYEYIALVELKSFSKAAERNYITQPALSRHIACIEEEFGGRLIERTTRTVEITPAGKTVYQYFSKMIGEYESARKAASLLTKGKDGYLRLSTPYYWIGDYTEAAWLKFNAKYPDSELRLYSCQPQDGLEDLLNSKIDLLIAPLYENVNENLRYVPFAKEPLAAATRVNHPLSSRQSLRIEDLAGCHFVYNGDINDLHSDKEGSVFVVDINDWVRNLLARHNVYPKDISYNYQADTLGLALTRSGGVTITPYGSRHMDRPYLRFIPLVNDDCYTRLCYYYRIDNDNPLIPRFIHCVTK